MDSPRSTAAHLIVAAGPAGNTLRRRVVVRAHWQIFSALLLSTALAGQAQEIRRAAPLFPPATPAAAMAGDRMQMVDPDKKLGVGDQVTIEIEEDREGGVARIVSATGELDVPPLGRVRVSGHTAREAAGEIKQLLERDYYYHATVHLSIDRVSPTAIRAGSVLVTGEVRRGGAQEIVAGEPLTLSNVLLRAGATEWWNAEKVQLTRLNKNGQLETTVVNFNKIIKSGDPRLDPVLQDGDRIYVPRRLIRLN